MTDALQELATLYNIKGDQFRAEAFERAAQEYNNIINAKSHKEIPGIGPAGFDAAHEFLRTGKIARLERLRRDPRVKPIICATQILGVSFATARKWSKYLRLRKNGTLDFAYLVHNLGRNKSAAPQMNRMQKIGIKYFKRIYIPDPSAPCRYRKRRFSCADVQKYARIIERVGGEILGSYRRKCNTQMYRNDADAIGDLDVIILDNVTIAKMIHALQPLEIITMGGKKASILRSISGTAVIRIDIFRSTSEQYPFYKLYATGSAQTNRMMRRAAAEHGLLLNEYGLWKRGRRATLNGDVIKTEQDIFDILELDYIPPEKR